MIGDGILLICIGMHIDIYIYIFINVNIYIYICTGIIEEGILSTCMAYAH